MLLLCLLPRDRLARLGMRMTFSATERLESQAILGWYSTSHRGSVSGDHLKFLRKLPFWLEINRFELTCHRCMSHQEVRQPEEQKSVKKMLIQIEIWIFRPFLVIFQKVRENANYNVFVINGENWVIWISCTFCLLFICQFVVSVVSVVSALFLTNK